MVLCLVSVSDCVMCTGPLDVMLSVMYVVRFLGTSECKSARLRRDANVWIQSAVWLTVLMLMLLFLLQAATLFAHARRALRTFEIQRDTKVESISFECDYL